MLFITLKQKRKTNCKLPITKHIPREQNRTRTQVQSTKPEKAKRLRMRVQSSRPAPEEGKSACAELIDYGMY